MKKNLNKQGFVRRVFLLYIAVFFLMACEALPDTIPVTSVTISQPTAEMIEGETVQLKATVLPEDATDKTIQWASSKKSVATISDDGLVSAISEGTSTITATAGGKTGTCRVIVTKKVIAVSSIGLNKEELNLVEGTEEILVATVTPDNATDKTVEWITSAPDIAIVDGGKVTALKEGEATITAKSGEQSATCKVIVAKMVIAVESIELNKTSAAMVEGDSDILVATVKPDDATDKTLTWITSDESIVTVDDSGMIKAIKEGKATVAVKAGVKTATCEVTVSKRVVSVESIILDKTSITMIEDESSVIVATVKPDNATDKSVVWSSSDASVATVNNGRVTAIKAGRAIITAKAGEKTAICEVTVNKRVIIVSSVTLNYSNLSLVKGEEKAIIATVKPDNSTDKTVTWSTSNNQVARVDYNGLVTAIKSGTATISAKAGDKTATCVVAVSTPIESVSLDRTSITLEEGQITELVAIISPGDADDKNVTWNSSASSVASVNQVGKVTAISAGTTIITAKAGDKTATCTVTVQKTVIQVTSITLNKTSLSLEKGKKETLNATVKPDNATNKTINWSSSDATIASVDANGMVTAHKGGQAIITAKAGEQSATCTVTVTVPVSSISLNQSSIYLTKGQGATLIASVQPYDASVNTVTWSSSNQSVATVDQNGKVVAKAGGTTRITASCGGYSAECSVTVTVPVTSITLNKTGLSLTKGATATLSASVNPTDATDKTITWTSSDTSVATVTAGTVTAKKSGSAIITASAGGQTATCSVTVTTPVTSISLDKTSLSIEEGQSANLTATVNPSDADNKTVSWSSSSSSIATVDNYGRVTAVHEGSATITAKAGDKTATCTVTVQKKVVSVTSITLNKTTLALEKGQTEALSATVKPDNATNKTVSWTSSNLNVATVDQNGKVVAKAGGTTKVTASCGGFSTECLVTVTVPVTSITLNKTSISLTKGATATLSATINPSDATDKTVSWSSSDVSVAAVASGTITAKKSGSATITASAGGKTATCTVTVTTPVTSISLDKTSLALEEGQYTNLTAVVNPSDADDKTVTWSSSSSSVATVDNYGRVTAVHEGSATITAQAGDKTATCTIMVQKKVIPVTSITVNKTTLALEKGQSEALVATVKPDNATNKAVTWSSSNQSVATVDQNGKVVAKAGGTAKITASCGGFSAECTVSVTVPVTSITLNETSLSLTKGTSATLSATVNPNDATDKTVSWSSSDVSIVTVTAGTVTAKKSGTASITASSAGHTATCSVTVTTPVTSISLDKTSLSLEEGLSANLTATVNPSDADDKTVTWSSSSPTVATVDNDGRITAVNAGSATITAQAGDKTATCTVTVQKKVIPVTSITLNKTSLTMDKGQTETLAATVEPDNATNKKVTWSSSNLNVATVDQNGKVVAKAGGTTKITASCGGFSAECSVNVTEPGTGSITIGEEPFGEDMTIIINN